MWFSFLNLGYLETTKSNFNKFVTRGLSNLSWKKCSLAGRKGASYCEMARKWECQNLLPFHLANSWSWIDYHTSSERGDSVPSADSWFFMQIDIFKHIFELLWGLPNCIHILVCHSVTSIQISGYHTPFEEDTQGFHMIPNARKYLVK